MEGQLGLSAKSPSDQRADTAEVFKRRSRKRFKKSLNERVGFIFLPGALKMLKKQSRNKPISPVRDGIITISAFVGFVAAALVWTVIEFVLIATGKIGGAQ
jgi:hypothetical protein